MNNLATLTKTDNSPLQLSSIDVNEPYLEEWNERSTDFVVLTKNGNLINNNLYRVGGMGTRDIKGKDYFMLLKHVEAKYEFDFIKRIYPKFNNKQIEAQRKHLDAQWCIIDKHGNEKFIAKSSLDNPYLVNDSCIYHFKNDYYNIETNEHYCQSYSKMETEEFIFLDNAYDKDVSKRGVMKINKKDGTYELFPNK